MMGGRKEGFNFKDQSKERLTGAEQQSSRRKIARSPQGRHETFPREHPPSSFFNPWAEKIYQKKYIKNKDSDNNLW